MQIIVDFGLGVQGYLELVRREGVRGLPVPEGARECPFCEDGHRLRRHGSYGRGVVKQRESDETRVIRLLCEVMGRTVSLLPHFLAPGKQHTWEVIGTYLEGRHLEGGTKVAAMEAATQVYAARQKGSYWTKCLEENGVRIQSYLGTIRSRVCSSPTASALVEALARGFPSLAEALAVHNLRIRQRLGVWLL